MKIAIIIPTYNEAENIEKVINRIFQNTSADFLVDVIVVDDNSPDGTADLVKKLINTNPQIKLIERPGKLGLASAYLDTIKKLLEENRYDAIGTMDADLSHDPVNITKMGHAVKNTDVIVGSRYVFGGGTKNWSLKRRFLSYFGNVYARSILNLPIKDVTAGFLMMRSDFLKKIDLSLVSCKGFAFLIELKYLFFLHGAKFEEVPILFMERQRGVSKISGSIIKEGLLLPLSMKMNKKKYKIH